MGAIKAYSFKKALIPVEDAKLVEAYRCPWTSNVFATKKEYLKHLAEYRVNHIYKLIYRNNFVKTRAEFNSMPDGDSIVKWIEDNSIWFAINAKNNYLWSDRDKFKIPKDFKLKILKFSLVYDEHTSNSHCCPRGGKTNWGGRTPGVPRGYLGWTGNIEYQVSHELLGFGSELFKDTGINTGTGGGGKTRSSYGIELFASDWPEMAAKIAMDRVENILVNGYYKPDRYSYNS